MMTMMTHPLQSPAWSAPGWPWSSSRRCWWSRCRARSTPGRCPRSSAEGSDRTGTGISLERRILRDLNVELGRRNQNNTFAVKQKEEECWRQKEPRLNWRRLYEIARDCRRNEESGKYLLWFSQFNLLKWFYWSGFWSSWSWSSWWSRSWHWVWGGSSRQRITG